MAEIDLVQEEESILQRRICLPRTEQYCKRSCGKRFGDSGRDQAKLLCKERRIPETWLSLTFVQLESEKEFLIDLSFRLSEIYQRPPSCIMVIITTEVAMLLGGNSEPAYYLTITALPYEIAATKNKRSTHLIQDFMLDTLQIIPKRGVVRFDAVAEESLATNGMTALQEIEQLERQSSEEDGFLRAISRQRSRRSKKSSVPAFTEKVKAGFPSFRAGTPSHQYFNTFGPGETKSTEASGLGGKRVKRRQSILAFFKK